ncbi:MAG: protein transport protein subunit gamma [Methanolobus sp.]|uniref:protein translocase SEC61 complex subunit gamma n=1 Tax=Methanolobus chelungpuianus TaxID=502115 RepID=UPI002114ED32|nr:protein translocase SEC61 complex subunit gamma [Methanolobus chelungpuianus]MDI3539021.1 protein transport protein subunit gamma [Methanolobus sp.]MDK2834103.1 protein transport protein subunit gamma [Methanolobus sp.]MDK2911325.1 protein transport protein subunit gamma [Methanolobus sp.]MDN5308867.1 protein transport protein subunit gamma [Methanolobus sp.]
MAEEFDIKELNSNIGQTLRSYLRVLKLTKKPSREEFLTIAKVAGLGILAIGFVGFIIYVLLVELPRMV